MCPFCDKRLYELLYEYTTRSTGRIRFKPFYLHEGDRKNITEYEDEKVERYMCPACYMILFESFSDAEEFLTKGA